MDPNERQRERELAIRRREELKDLETEADHSPRPLEGLASAPTSWTGEQDDSQAAAVHGHDEADSVRRSQAQVPPAPPNRTLPGRGEPGEDDR